MFLCFLIDDTRLLCIKLLLYAFSHTFKNHPQKNNNSRISMISIIKGMGLNHAVKHTLLLVLTPNIKLLQDDRHRCITCFRCGLQKIESW